MVNNHKFKITLTSFLVISVIIGIFTLSDIQKKKQKLLEAQMEKSIWLSNGIADRIMLLMLNNRWQDLQVFIEGLATESGEIERVRVFQPDSTSIVASTSPKEIGKKLSIGNAGMSPEQQAGRPFLSGKEGRQYASNFTVIRNQPVCYRCHTPEHDILGILSVDVSLSGIDKSINEFKKERLLYGLIIFFLIAGGFLVVIESLIDRPVRRMIRVIRRIEEGELSARMEEGKNDEFRLMAKSFNSMLESLESAQKEIEACHTEQMQRAAKLASLGEIISGIAHEIKNPLTGISCAVQAIQSEMAKDDPKKEITAEILNHIKRLDRTVKDLLNYARPRRPHFMPLKINDIIDKAVFFVYPEAKKQNVVLETENIGEIPDVMVDPDQMQQVFLNLMINAVQAMPNGGKLKVTTLISEKNGGTDRDDFQGQSGRDVIVIRFEDSGRGIESDYLESIFEPFFTKKSKGTGLGLAISRRIAQEHGGDITVKSEAGKGSVFILFLPTAEKAPDERSDPSAAPEENDRPAGNPISS